MAYMHIENLYRVPELLQCYALEKIHGTSAHIRFHEGMITFFSGGESHLNFVKLFDQETLLTKFNEKFVETDEVFIYGEAFGGSQQGMSATYGKALRFMAFDVKLNGKWLNVPSAEGFVQEFGLQFVPYERGPLSLPWLDEQRDRPSRVAVVPDKPSEGVVIRPIYEMVNQDGSRVIAKHKRAEFRETKTPREVNPNKELALIKANNVAIEFVTLNRLQHVLDKTPFNDMKDIGNIIKTMQEDVKREGCGEFVWSREIANSIAKETLRLLKNEKSS